MDFKAELKRSSQRKTASLDNVYQLVLETNDPRVLDLAKLPSDTMFEVTILIEGSAKGSQNADTTQD